MQLSPQQGWWGRNKAPSALRGPQIRAGGAAVPAGRFLLQRAAADHLHGLIFQHEGKIPEVSPALYLAVWLKATLSDSPLQRHKIFTPSVKIREEEENLSMPPNNCRGWKLNPPVALTERGTVRAGMPEPYTCTFKAKIMEYYRSVRGNSAPYSKVLRAIKQTHMTWKNKKGTTLNQAQQQAQSDWLFVVAAGPLVTAALKDSFALV